MKLGKILDDTKDALGISSDYELAKKLGVSKQAISNYRLGQRAPDEFACLQIAEALGKPLDTIIATVKAASEKDETRREAWENYMKRLGGVAAGFAMALIVAISCSVTMVVTSSPAEAHGYEAAQGKTLYYVNRSRWKRMLSQIKSILRRIGQKCSFGMNVSWIAQIAT